MKRIIQFKTSFFLPGLMVVVLIFDSCRKKAPMEPKAVWDFDLDGNYCGYVIHEKNYIDDSVGFVHIRDSFPACYTNLKVDRILKKITADGLTVMDTILSDLDTPQDTIYGSAKFIAQRTINHAMLIPKENKLIHFVGWSFGFPNELYSYYLIRQ